MKSGGTRVCWHARAHTNSEALASRDEQSTEFIIATIPTMLGINESARLVRALRSHAKERPDAQADALLSYLMQVPHG